MCNSYERLPLLLAGYPSSRRARRGWFRLLGEFFTVCDNVSQHALRLRQIFAENPTLWPLMMNAAERRTFDALPDTIVIYRGCGPVNRLGLSWSLDREKAMRFPFLNRYRTENPELLTAAVRKSQVYAVKLNRAESEIIADVREADLSLVEVIPGPGNTQ